jgi:hypothetical protein
MMTALLFTLEPERICLAMDTVCLFVDPEVRPKVRPQESADTR